MSATEFASWAVSIATIVGGFAVVVAAIIYQRQLEAMTKARELESLLVVMKYVDDINLRLARYFMLEHWTELSAILVEPYTWETRNQLEARVRELTSGALSVHDIDLAVNALNNVCFLVVENYAPAAAVKKFMKNSLLHAWQAFEPYIQQRRTRRDTIGEPSQYGAHFEAVVRSLGYRIEPPN